MKKIISFKKELMFKTKVCEITSISLEHIIKEKDDDLVSGEFLINGEYKMTEGSINKEKYDFKLPFDIALNSNYDVDTIYLDIDNFYYEIINSEILKVNIDLLIEAKEKEIIPEVIKEIPKEELPTCEDFPNIPDEIMLEHNLSYDKEDMPDNERKEIFNDGELENEISNISDSNIVLENNTNIIENKKEIIDNMTKEEKQNVEVINNNINVNNNIFNNINDNETYKAYYVYIVKEDDTIDKVLEKYGITKEQLENYNNLENIKPFDKIVIPTDGK